MKHTILQSIVLAAGTITSSAATLATYIDGASYPDTNTPAASSDANVTASNMSFVGLSGGFGGPVRDAFGSVPIGGAGDTSFWYVVNGQQDLAADPGAGGNPTGDYYGFTVTASAGNTLDLTSIAFDWGSGNNDGSTLSGGTFGYRVFASVDGGAFTSVGSDSVTTDVASGAWVDHTSANIDLTGLAATVDGGNVEFRIQPITSSASPGVMNAFQQFNINGDVVAIPEPSSTALLGLGGLALMLRRRR